MCTEVKFKKRDLILNVSSQMMGFLISPRDIHLSDEAETHLAPLIRTAKSSSKLIIKFDKVGEFEFNWDWDKNWFKLAIIAELK